MLPVWNWANALAANSVTHSTAVKTAKNLFIPTPFINVTDRVRSRMPAQRPYRANLLRQKELVEQNCRPRMLKIQPLVESRSVPWISQSPRAKTAVAYRNGSITQQ